MKEVQLDPKSGPPHSLKERVRNFFFPRSLIVRQRIMRELQRGERELHILPFIVDRTRASIDVGANIGVYTYLLSKYSTHVHAFEPNPKIYRYLTTWKRGNVTTYDFALSDRSSQGVLRVPRTRGGYSNQRATLSEKCVVADAEEYGVMPIKTLKLDDLDLRNIGFIKIDVEGHEFEVLSGATETIAREKPVMLVEIEERYNGIRIEEGIERVEAMGYLGFALFQDMSLKKLDFFDPEKNHRKCIQDEDQSEYIFNFIFMPRK